MEEAGKVFFSLAANKQAVVVRPRTPARRARFSINLSTQPPRSLWQQLEPGPYGCGFKSLWKLDYGRTYQPTYPRVRDHDGPGAVDAVIHEKSPRPILINLWYPTYPTGGRASDPPMPYGDYLHIPSDNPKVTRFSEELATYARNILVQGAFGKKETELSPAEQEAVAALMQTPTTAYRDVRAAEERFPLVLYHMGAGSSFQNNTVMCEYLASHGYVVISSAFQKNDGTSLNTDGERSAADIAFLLSYAQGLPFVDWNHVGMIGHSAGAHAAVIYQTLPGCAVDAAVCLDTTEDYFALVQPATRLLVKSASFGVR